MIVIAGNKTQQEAFATNTEKLIWVEHASAFKNHPNAEGFIDLLFEADAAHVELLSSLLPKPVVVNSVVDTLKSIHPQFVRINGWSPFLAASQIEAAGEAQTHSAVESIFIQLGRTVHWLPDEPGFVRARVVAMIINEAYLALEEGVSAKEEINTAMKLGTAYPYGPFEWAQKIGLSNIVALLKSLGSEQTHYLPSQSMLADL